MIWRLGGVVIRGLGVVARGSICSRVVFRCLSVVVLWVCSCCRVVDSHSTDFPSPFLSPFYPIFSHPHLLSLAAILIMMPRPFSNPTSTPFHTAHHYGRHFFSVAGSQVLASVLHGPRLLRYFHLVSYLFNFSLCVCVSGPFRRNELLPFKPVRGGAIWLFIAFSLLIGISCSAFPFYFRFSCGPTTGGSRLIFDALWDH